MTFTLFRNEIELALLSADNPGVASLSFLLFSFYSIFSAESSWVSMCLPLAASITFNSDRQEAEAEGTLYLIGFHSAFLINKRRPSHKKILPLMALQGSRFGLGTKDSLGTAICRRIKWEGSKRALSKTPFRENNPVFSVSVNQLCLICLQLGEKGHSMSVTCKSSVANIYHMDSADTHKQFCV